jgi:methyl-accepting chemotaxis protein
MSIRNKLISIVVGLIVLYAVSFGLYLILQLPIQGMEAEREVLYDYEAALLNLQIQNNCILNRPTKAQLLVFEGFIKSHDDIYAKLTKLKALPKASAESGKAFKSMQALQLLYYPGVTAVYQAANEGYELFGPEMDLRRVRTLAALKEAVAGESNGIGPYILQVTTKRDTAYDALEMAGKKARFLIDTAAKEIQAARVRNASASLAAACLVMALGVALIILFARRMIRSISSIQGAIALMAEGRIGAHIADLGADELGAVSRDLNHLSDQMAGALGHIKDSAGKNGENAAVLGRSVLEFSSSSHEIQRNAQMIGSQMSNVDGLTEKAISDMESIAVAVKALDKGIETQAGLVADSGAAVTQMLASIENIARIAEADSKAADELAVHAEDGMNVVDGTFSKVAEIGSSVDDIQEMVQIISDIAGQTNLLAMNAEIEAAHAGEAGKGFSVVAGEIRNLAEAAGNSSREIDARTKAIIDTIEQASSMREASIEALKGVIERIQSVARSVAEIYSNASEIRAGSRQIQASVESLKRESEQIERESSSVASRAESTRGSFSELGRISHETAAGANEMSAGLAQVAKSLQDLSTMVGSIGEVGQAMKNATDAFTIAE